MLGKSAPGKVLEACARQGVDGWGGEGWDKDKTGGVTGHYTAMNWFNNYEVENLCVRVFYIRSFVYNTRRI